MDCQLSRRRTLVAVTISVLCLAGVVAPPRTAAQSPSAAGRIRIAVVKSLDIPQYNSALEGFLGTLGNAGHNPVVSTVTLSADESSTDTQIRSALSASPDLVLALGTRAAHEVSLREKKIPIIYSMVLNPASGSAADNPLPAQANLTGATLNIPLDTQVEHLRALFPTARRLGIISDPSRTEAMVNDAREIGRRNAMDVRVWWVDNENEIPDAVRALTDSVDVLWMLPDETVFTPRSSRFIIFELIKAGVPILGLSSAYVKAGAVVALDCDYTDVGRQSGELAVRVLAGGDPSSMKATTPRVFTLALNAKVREHLRIAMDSEALKKLETVTF